MRAASNHRVNTLLFTTLFLLGFGTRLSATEPVVICKGNSLRPVENVLQSAAESSPQRAFGQLIEDVCPGTLIAANQFDLNPNGDLKQRCDEMWANALIGNDIPGVTSGLQGSANEEDAALASTEVDVGSTTNSKI